MPKAIAIISNDTNLGDFEKRFDAIRTEYEERMEFVKRNAKSAGETRERSQEAVWKELETYLRQTKSLPHDYDKEKHCLSFNYESDCILMDTHENATARHPLAEFLGDFLK